MKLRIPRYQVDAFAEELFGGNPAAVCPLNAWLSDELLQNIGMENNLAETAFIVKNRDQYEIRWFTPTVEVALCGHATLAAAFVLFNELGHYGDFIEFESHLSGKLGVARTDDKLTLDFPVDSIKKVNDTAAIANSIGVSPIEGFAGKTDFMALLSSEEVLVNLKPDFGRIAELNCRGLIVTAPGNEVDYVSRFFAPQSGVNEDPATGSSQTTLAPYWAKRLNKNRLVAKQLSSRIGTFDCEVKNDRVHISGHCFLFSKGEIIIDC